MNILVKWCRKPELKLEWDQGAEILLGWSRASRRRHWRQKISGAEIGGAGRGDLQLDARCGRRNTTAGKHNSVELLQTLRVQAD